ACWSGETFDYDGEFFRVEAARQLPVPLARIPVVIGGAGPRMLRLVAQHADWWNCMVTELPRLDELRAQVGSARVSTQQIVGLVTDEREREAIEQRARRRFPYPGLVVGSSPEMLEWFGGMRDRGVERSYVGFADFAAPETLAAFGRD